MSSPNVEGTQDKAVLSGGVFGASVGKSASDPAGFHGATSVQDPALVVPTLSGTYATDYAALQTFLAAVAVALHNKGITG